MSMTTRRAGGCRVRSMISCRRGRAHVDHVHVASRRRSLEHVLAVHVHPVAIQQRLHRGLAHRAPRRRARARGGRCDTQHHGDRSLRQALVQIGARTTGWPSIGDDIADTMPRRAARPRGITSSPGAADASNARRSNSTPAADRGRRPRGRNARCDGSVAIIRPITRRSSSAVAAAAANRPYVVRGFPVTPLNPDRKVVAQERPRLVEHTCRRA